jgi:hypothetical protein
VDRVNKKIKKRNGKKVNSKIKSRKWKLMYEEADICIFLCAISEYNMVLYEDDTTNRLTESMDLYESIVNSEELKNKKIIVLFNKIDILKLKLQTYEIKKHFSGYKGFLNKIY